MSDEISNDRRAGMIRRRTFLKGASAVGLAMAAPAIITRRGYAQDAPTVVVNSIRSLSNPYHATWKKGGEAFGKREPYQVAVRWVSEPFSDSAPCG